MGPAIIVITPYLAPALVPAYFGKNILPLELGITLYLVGYFDYFFPVFGFIAIMIEVEMVVKLFG